MSGYAPAELVRRRYERGRGVKSRKHMQNAIAKAAREHAVRIASKPLHVFERRKIHIANTSFDTGMETRVLPDASTISGSSGRDDPPAKAPRTPFRFALWPPVMKLCLLMTLPALLLDRRRTVPELIWVLELGTNCRESVVDGSGR